jgi:hypothetical protein
MPQMLRISLQLMTLLLATQPMMLMLSNNSRRNEVLKQYVQQQ